MKRRAFTMAEILLTVIIIGTVAAVTLPLLQHISPNKEMVMLKKAYFLTARTVNELINDEDFYPDASTEALSGFSHTDLSDVGLPQASYHGRSYSGNSKFCGLFATKFNLRGDARCENARIALNAHGNFETADGIYWSMPISNFAGGFEDIMVDVNGSKNNNCGDTAEFADNRCANGTAPDRFVIRVYRDGRIEVPSTVGRKYLATQNTSKTYNEILTEINNGN